MAIIQFHDVYVTSRSAVGGPVEAKGPLAEMRGGVLQRKRRV